MIYKVNPVLNYRIWGGNKLNKVFNYQGVDPIGEAFLVSCLPGLESIIENQTLSEFYKLNQKYFGLNNKVLPLRVNLIDALDDLSIQLHPNFYVDDNFKLKDGIDELWYVVEASEDAEVVLGLKYHDKIVVEKLISDNKWEVLLNKVKVKAGDFIEIPSGMIHAICKGCFIYEVTYNIDITYRMYDYQRIDLKTNTKRPLHLEKGLKNLSYQAKSKVVNSGDINSEFTSASGFKIKRIKCNKDLVLLIDQFYFITVIEGKGIINGCEVDLFDTIFVGNNYQKLDISGELVILMSTYSKGDLNGKSKTLLSANS